MLRTQLMSAIAKRPFSNASVSVTLVFGAQLPPSTADSRNFLESGLQKRRANSRSVYRDVGAFSKVRPRLLQLRFGVFAAENRLKIVQNAKTKNSKFRGRLELDEAVSEFSRRRHCVRSCPMGWLEGINRRGVRTKRLCSLPSADRACWKIFFEICWEAEIDDQIRRKIRARKNRKSLKNKTSPNFHRTFVWCPRMLWRPKTRPNDSFRLSPWPLLV